MATSMSGRNDVRNDKWCNEKKNEEEEEKIIKEWNRLST